MSSASRVRVPGSVFVVGYSDFIENTISPSENTCVITMDQSAKVKVHVQELFACRLYDLGDSLVLLAACHVNQNMRTVVVDERGDLICARRVCRAQLLVEIHHRPGPGRVGTFDKLL